MKQQYELNDFESIDFDAILVKAETSFGLNFEKDDFIHIENFGQLCDHIADKIQLENSDNCTTQQAFYKLREAILATTEIEKKAITADLLLVDLLPRQQRRSTVKKLEIHLGFKLNILRPAHWITVVFVLTFLVSFYGLFSNWQLGLAGLSFSIGGLWLTKKIGNELSLATVGEVVKKMTRENYLKSRRNSMTFNKQEIEKVLIDLFSSELDLDRTKLTRNAKFA